jgi:nitrogen regulatory protein PII
VEWIFSVEGKGTKGVVSLTKKRSDVDAFIPKNANIEVNKNLLATTRTMIIPYLQNIKIGSICIIISPIENKLSTFFEFIFTPIKIYP